MSNKMGIFLGKGQFQISIEDITRHFGNIKEFINIKV
jgi:hypothetical protein